MTKNTFAFTLTTAATLSLSLMLSGCGDGGSTAPNPLEGDTSSKVVFNYSVLAQKLSAKTDIPANIASVKYSFKGVDENQKAFTDTSDKYTYKFAHKDQAYDRKVTIKDVSTYTTEVTAAYYDINDELVAVGVDKLDWDKTTKVAEVKDPTVKTVDENSLLTLTTDNLVISKDGQVKLTLEVIPAGGDKAVDITDLATIDGMDEKVFAHSEGDSVGLYTGIGYGKSGVVSAAIGSKKVELDKAIYVTDQTPAKIEFSLLPIEGKEIALDNEFADYRHTFMLYAADENELFGLKVAGTDLSYESGKNFYYAINEQPFAVYATEYTNADNKGPQPDYPVNITGSDKVSVDMNIYSDQQIDKKYVHLEVENGSVLKATKVDSNSTDYLVTTKYDDGSDQGLTDDMLITVEIPNTKLAFVRKCIETVSPEDLFAADVRVDPATQVLEYKSLELKGIIDLPMGRCVANIPESMIPADQYPNLKEARYLTPNQTTKPISSILTTYEHIGSGNEYAITVNGRPESNIIVGIERSEDAVYPELWATQILCY